MKQYTFMMLKPDAFFQNHQTEIIELLKEKNLIIESAKQIQVNMSVMQTLLLHYENVINQKGSEFNFPGRLFQTFYFHGPHFIMPMKIAYDGNENIITYTRKIVGKTNPVSADTSSIRGMFSHDSYEKADGEGRLVHNVIHASSSKEEAKRELEIWEKYL